MDVFQGGPVGGLYKSTAGWLVCYLHNLFTQQFIFLYTSFLFLISSWKSEIFSFGTDFPFSFQFSFFLFLFSALENNYYSLDWNLFYGLPYRTNFNTIWLSPSVRLRLGEMKMLVFFNFPFFTHMLIIFYFVNMQNENKKRVENSKISHHFANSFWWFIQW